MKLPSKQFCLTIILMTGVASAQVATGTPPFGSFGGGPFDKVNLGNLNVHFAIPVLNKPGRGVPFTYSLSYDSSVWSPALVNGVKQWQPAYNWGWNAQTAAKLGYVSSFSGETDCWYTVGRVQYEGSEHLWTTNYVYHDPWGVSHPFAGTSNVWTGNGGGTCHLGTNNKVTATAGDGSGYTLNANLDSGTVTTRSGAVISPPFSSGTGAGTYKDANGNEITVNSSGQFFDTLSGTTPVLTVSAAAPPTATTFTYTAPSGGSASYTMSYQQYTVKTDFVVSGVSEYGPLANSLVSSIQLPDGSQYTFAYEETPAAAGCTPKAGTYSGYCVTGRILSVTLPTGGTITYAYNGIESDGSTASLTRTLNPGGEWQYARLLSGATWTTTITDPNSNQTAINFAKDGNTASYNFYETQRQVYQGSVSPSNLLGTSIRCYNAVYANCAQATVSSPITQTDIYSRLPNNSTRLSEVLRNGYGLVTDDKEYNYGVTTGSAPGTTGLVRETSTSYASLGNGIVNKPSSVIVYDWTSGTKTELASTTYAYDGTGVTTSSGTPQHVSITGSRGNLTTLTKSTSSTATLSTTYTYYDTGEPNVATDVNGAQTTYVYGAGSCGNSFPTGVNEPLSLSRSMTWNCTGGVALTVTDENGKVVTADYSTDPDFWRPDYSLDQLNNKTTLAYSTQPSAVESTLSFNGTNSVSDLRTTLDGFGRAVFSQRLQAPGGTNYDTSEVDYNSMGQPYRSTMPYSATGSPSSDNTNAPATTTTYDALGRVLTVTDANNGMGTYTYTNNDILQKLSGGQTFQKQFEYDGLGRLTSVCEMSLTLPGTGACGQNVAQNGYLTLYTYDALGRLLTVTQNAQPVSGSNQTRSFTYDWLSRTLTESNPETGNGGVTGKIQYTYDSACTTTPASPGDLTGKLDNAGNTTCYSYDKLHRMTAGGYNNVCRRFNYDTSLTPPTGVTVANTNTRLLEVSTDNCASIQYTVEWFSYSPRGELTDVYESTPHSGGYYHTTASYWPTGALATLSGIPGVPTINYGANGVGLDGEGRITQVTAASGTNPVTGVTYSTSSTTNPLGALTGVTFGSADSDSFTYDPNTGRIATYTFSVNGKTDAGTLTWNPNGTLQKLVINDQIPSTTDSQTCTYGYDELQRLSNATCGTLWVQNFTYDPFGNITKNVPNGDGGLQFLPTYWTSPPTNQFTSLPGVSVSYDKNGNLLTDNLNTYTWDPNWGTMTTVSTGSTTVTSTYDALGRMVENNAGGTYTEFVYGPTGTKLAKANGTTLVKAFIALPGGAKAIYNPSGLAYYRHSDWLGSSRLTSTASRAMYSSSAYAPFGEQYAIAGSADASYTGQDQDTVSNLYDFPARRHNPSQGRWISPDPSGRAAVSLTNPQSWNRYAYVNNNPLRLIDPKGLDQCDSEDDSCNGDCEDDESCNGDGGGDGGGDSGNDGDNSGNNGDDNSGCAPDDTQCQQQEANQALQNAALALLTNSNCAGLIGGPSAAGQAAAIGAVAGQLFGNPNQNIQFSATPDPGVPSGAFAVTVGTTVPTSGASISLGQDFYDPLATIINTVGTAGMGLTFGQNQELTVLHEYGHALGIVNPTPGIPYAPATNIIPDNDPSTGPAISGQNDSNVASDCLQGGNVPTQTSQVDGTIQ